MIRDRRTEQYQQPLVPLTEEEHELHVHYASNAIARGHEATCELVTTARNWPHMSRGGNARCTCKKAAR